VAQRVFVPVGRVFLLRRAEAPRRSVIAGTRRLSPDRVVRSIRPDSGILTITDSA
jgi:hypothetical protein